MGARHGEGERKNRGRLWRRPAKVERRGFGSKAQHHEAERGAERDRRPRQHRAGAFVSQLS